MKDSTTRNCPQCGSTVSTSDIRCEHCQALIVDLNCIFCGKPTKPMSKACQECGDGIQSLRCTFGRITRRRWKRGLIGDVLVAMFLGLVMGFLSIL